MKGDDGLGGSGQIFKARARHQKLAGEAVAELLLRFAAGDRRRWSITGAVEEKAVSSLVTDQEAQAMFVQVRPDLWRNRTPAARRFRINDDRKAVARSREQKRLEASCGTVKRLFGDVETAKVTESSEVEWVAMAARPHHRLADLPSQVPQR
jgi:hypothetical protein